MADAHPRSEDDSASGIVARGGMVNILGNVVGVLDPLFLIVVSRLLGADVLGSYVLATTYVVMFQRLGVLGLDNGLLRHIPLADALDETERKASLNAVLGTALRITIGLSLLATIVLFFFSDLVVTLGGDDATGDGAWWLAWMVLALPGRALSQIFLFALRGRSNMVAFVLVNSVVLPGLLLLMALPGIAFGFGKEALVVAYVASSYVGAFVSYLLFQRYFSTVTMRSMARAPHDSSLVSFSLPQGFTDLLNFLLARVDILMIAAFFPDEPELVAVYAMASLLAGFVKKVRQAFDTSLAPVFSGLLAQNDTVALQSIYARVARWIYGLFMLVAGFICLAAPLLLSSFGPQYVEYWIAVPILVFGRLLNAAGGPAQTALLMAGRSRLEFVNNLAINLANVGFNLLLISRYGVYGAALASSLSLTLFNAARIIEVRHIVGVLPNIPDALKVTVAATVAAIPGVLVLIIGLEERIWLAGLAGASFLIVYPGALYVLGLDEDVRKGWSKVQTWWAKRRARSVTA